MACLRFTRKVWDSFARNGGHDARCFPNLKIHKATPGFVEASLQVEGYNLNRNQTVHGGLILSLTDTIGSLTVASKGQWMTGVSTDIGTTFARPAGRIGDTLYMKGSLVSMGKTLAFTRVDFTDAQGRVVAYGNHTKFVGPTLSHEKNVKFSEDGEDVVEGNLEEA